jgi:curved DNA-binding protein CbpA
VRDVPVEWLALDLYAELGVPRAASHDQVRNAYRDLAQRFHPDRHPADLLAEDRFKRISAAYKVLADPLSRASYDRLHLAGPRTIPVRPAPAHRVPPRARSRPKDRRSSPARPIPTPSPSRDEASALVGFAFLVAAGAILLIAAIAIAVFVIGPDCDVPRELAQLGCPPAP